MPAAVSPNVRPTVERDDLDDLFNYDAGIDATFNQSGQDWNVQDNRNNNNDDQQPQAEVADIDEEVKVTKKRKPVAKLDEDRLLSQQGIPKLRKIAKDRIRINGKGHEFSDMARLLNTYQLWLDDLFPKAKFMDGVSMIEKLGHKKRMQLMRKEWINEGKPKPPQHEDDDDFAIPDEDVPSQRQSVQRTEGLPRGDAALAAANPQRPQQSQPNGGASGESSRQPTDQQEEPDDDELDALLADSAPALEVSRPNNTHSVSDHDPDEDELDALMAEDAQREPAPKSLFGGPMPSGSHPGNSIPDDFADDEDAMAGMDW